jgi:tRNA dimethylallyltransferase
VSLPALLVIAGATATGKTGLAIQVARQLIDEGIPAEVISADSRQVYRGLDIGTAKATPAERQGVPHHGLDLVDPDQRFSVADFADHVAVVLPPIAANHGLAILVGGTGLYLRAIARGLDTAALPSDPSVRARLEKELLDEGADTLAARLKALAPERAAAVDLRNPRRVVRALEIATIDGGIGPLPAARGYGAQVEWVGLDVDRPTHLAWIEGRARAQFDAGLIEEARVLRDGFDPALPAFSAIGYREAWAVLDGTLDREAAIAEDARRNAAFAKRQRTWFRAEPGVTWLDAGREDLATMAGVAARRLLEGRTGEVAR